MVTEHFSHDEVQHPVLHLPMERGQGPQAWRHVHPPLCPQGHPLEYPNVTHGHTPPRFHRFHCLPCIKAREPHNTWYVLYPTWDKEAQEWVFPGR